MMRVVQFSRYGGPEVLETAEAELPPAVARSIRIRVAAAAVNPADVNSTSARASSQLFAQVR